MSSGRVQDEGPVGLLHAREDLPAEVLRPGRPVDREALARHHRSRLRAGRPLLGAARAARPTERLDERQVAPHQGAEAVAELPGDQQDHTEDGDAQAQRERPGSDGFTYREAGCASRASRASAAPAMLRCMPPNTVSWNGLITAQ